MTNNLKLISKKALKSSLSSVPTFNFHARQIKPIEGYSKEHLKSFEIFNKMNAKFRVAVINKCNMNCFFCHNEGMKNPRSPGDKVPLSKTYDETLNIDKLSKLMNDFCDLGGGQLNITGGEPLARKDIVQVLKNINKQGTRIIINSNVLLADRLLKEPAVKSVDAIYASLHTTKESDFKENLGINAGAKKVMENMIKLQQHGYRVQINYSLGEYNKNEFESVMDYAIKNQIDLKAITLIRSDADTEQYGKNKDWCNPKWIEDLLIKKNAKQIEKREGFGGRVKAYRVDGQKTHKIEIKNVGRGRLVTDFCKGCKHFDKCGEGIYALRSGVDGIWKPCLLNHDKHSSINLPEDNDMDFKPQILQQIHNMVGEWGNHQFYEGDPK